MKNIAILFLSIYQKIISPILHQALGIQQGCRFNISCSQYAKNKIEEEGLLKGLQLSFARLLTCQPLYKVNKI